MRTKIVGDGWITRLAVAVKAAKRGDVIEVSSPAAAQLGHRAAERVNGTEDHGVIFEVDGKVCPYAADPLEDEEG